jgi:hypothetical protein
MLHWLESLRGKGCILGEGHHRHLGDVAMITAKSTTLLKGMKEDDFQGCFNQWKQRWDKCLASEGDKNDVPDNMYNSDFMNLVHELSKWTTYFPLLLIHG